MSCFTEVKCESITDIECLKKALGRMGVTTRQNDRVRGLRRSVTADLVAEMKDRNDVGFVKDKNGYKIVADSDAFYRTGGKDKWIGQVKQNYLLFHNKKTLRRMGHSDIHQSTLTNGTIRLQVNVHTGW